VPELRIRDYLKLAAGDDIDEAETDWLLQALALPNAETRILATDSGARRRLEVTGAVASRPAVLLLDEPAAGLTDEAKLSAMNIIFGSATRSSVRSAANWSTRVPTLQLPSYGLAKSGRSPAAGRFTTPGVSIPTLLNSELVSRLSRHTLINRSSEMTSEIPRRANSVWFIAIVSNSVSMVGTTIPMPFSKQISIIRDG
jgi:hypothetical protein